MPTKYSCSICFVVIVFASFSPALFAKATISLSVKKLTNGVGRELSAQNKPVTSVHHSKGINLSQARLNLETDLSEKNASVRIIDKKEDGFAIGTTVNIEFNLH